MEHYTLEISDDNLLIVKPVDKLTNEQYDKMKPIIEDMGGHWREKVKGFVFSTDRSHVDTYTKEKEDMQFFPTPKSVADRMVELLDMRKMEKFTMPKILEPSAGTGELLKALPSWLTPVLYIVEPDTKNIEALQVYKDKYNKILNTTFEIFYNMYSELIGTLDYVLMNPPFSGGRDALHTMMAYEFLKPGGTLVAVISENALYYDNESSEKLRKWLKETDAYIEPIPYGSFKESGTNVDTVIIKIVKQ